MFLLIDIGNSRVKYCLAERGKLHDVKIGSHEESRSALAETLKKESISNAIISSTASQEFTEELEQLLNKKTEVHMLSHRSQLPFEMGYETIDTLGLDRMANVSAARYLFTDETSLVIDVGTCITYDILEKGKVYRGGAISPGLQMRFKAMNDYSARLPRLLQTTDHVYPGASTEGSLKAGVFYGILGEIHQFVEETEQSFGGHKVLLTGGDVFLFEEDIKYPTFANPKLTLYGLYEILAANI